VTFNGVELDAVAAEPARQTRFTNGGHAWHVKGS
jgi:hypothetical protein